MKKTHYTLLFFSFLLVTCSTEDAELNNQNQTKVNQPTTLLIESILADSDFLPGFGKFLKDKPSNGKVARIEFWLDTLLDREAITYNELKTLNLRAGTKLELFSSTFSRKFQMMDSLLQNAMQNNQPVNESVIEEWEITTNTTLGIDEYMLSKHLAHQEYTRDLVAIAEKEIAARNRLLALYPQLQDDRFVAKCIEHYYFNL